jgi:GNAT superfamily N-acetyltransferase
MSKHFKADQEVLPVLPTQEQPITVVPPVLTEFAHKVQRNREDYGLRVTLQKTVAYLARWIYFRQAYRIYRINVDTVQPRDPAGAHNFTFKLLNPQNTDMIAQVEDTAEWLRGQVKERIEAGQLCLVALDGEVVAGFNLINLKEAPLLLVKRVMRLPRESAWSEHIAVRKEYRRMGLATTLRHRIFEVLKKGGIRKLYGGTLPTNTASLCLTKSIGFRILGDMRYRKLFSMEKWSFQRIRE